MLVQGSTPQPFNFRRHFVGAHVHCPLCNKRLFRPESEIAGIGPVCQKRIKFAEYLEESELTTMMTSRQSFSQNNRENKTLIFKNTKGQLILATLLSVDSNDVIYLNRQRAQRVFEETDSLTEATLSGIEIESVSNIEYVSNIDLPDHADLKRAFTAFNKDYLEDIVHREEIEKDLKEKKLNAVYYPVIDKRDMTSAQIKAREELMVFKENHPRDYHFAWANGVYQRSTFLARIQNHSYPESIRLKAYLNKISKFKNLEVKDYGLTDDEIETGLTHSEQKIESLLFKAYSQSNRNINLMIALAEKIDTLNPVTRLKAHRALSNMLNAFRYTKEDLKNDLK